MAEVISAVIGATAAIGGILIRDVALPFWSEKRNKLKSNRDIFGLYALPLAQSAESLLWRLSEIIEGRSQFMHNDCPKTNFYTYKHISSCYRIAILLGWMRAIDREIARLPPSGAAASTDIEEAVKRIRHVLADGEHVELKVVENIFEIWRVDRNFTEREKNLFGIRAVHEIDKFLCENDLTRMSDVRNISNDMKVIVLNRIRDLLNNDYGEHISDDVVNGTMAHASEAISIVEAWLYRDWQDAIGDCVLINDSSSARHYRTISYAEFEDIASDRNNKINIWYKRISNLFDEMDMNNGKFDMRVRQLRNFYESIGNLLLALNKHTPRTMDGIISKETINKAFAASSQT